MNSTFEGTIRGPITINAGTEPDHSRVLVSAKNLCTQLETEVLVLFTVSERVKDVELSMGYGLATYRSRARTLQFSIRFHEQYKLAAVMSADLLPLEN